MRRLVTVTWIAFSLLVTSAFGKPITAGAAPAEGGVTLPVSPAAFTTPGKVNALIPLSDGRMLIAGSFVTVGGQAAPRSLAILKSDGSLDATFRVDPKLQVYEVYAAALQGDGKVILAGWFKQPPVPPTYFLLRLNSNGTLDESFDPWSINAQVYALLVDGDKIVIGGNFTEPTPKIARLNQDGTVDPAFDSAGSGPDFAVRGIARQSSGQTIIVGEFSTYNGTAQTGVARLNVNGSLDASFAAGGFRPSERVAVLRDDSVVVGGTNLCGDSLFAWYSAAGVLKPALSPAPDSLEAITAFYPLPDGGFLIGGWNSPVCINGSPTSHEGQVWRYASDGAYRTLTSFGDESDALALAARSDGKLLVGGQGRPSQASQIGSFDGLALLDLANDGLEQVETFRPLVGDEAEIYDLSRYQDGRLLVAGDFSHANGSPRFGVARLLANGSLDPDFHPFADQPGGWSWAALALPDGRAVAGYGDSGLVLIGTDGSLTDLSAFNDYDRVSALARQDDGKVLVGSLFGLGVRRLKADFSGADPDFNSGDASDSVLDLAVQDGKILVAGSFTQYNHLDYPGLVRLKDDGSIDDSFAPPPFMLWETVPATLYSVTPLAGGNVLVGGDFTTAGGAEHPAFVRLSGSGALDAAFTSPADVHTVKSACVQGDDGSIWIGGSDSSYFRNPLATHFDENGLFDPTSQRAYQAAHAEGAVNVVLCATDGLSWGGGRFSTVDGRPFYGLAKYLSLDQQIFLPLILR